MNGTNETISLQSAVQYALIQFISTSHNKGEHMNWYLEAITKKYATFSGRSSRKELWMFILIYSLIELTLNILHIQILIYTYLLFMIIPYIAICVRRMHDIGRSGWWNLLPVFNLIIFFFDSQHGENRFGPNPKEID